MPPNSNVVLIHYLEEKEKEKDVDDSSNVISPTEFGEEKVSTSAQNDNVRTPQAQTPVTPIESSETGEEVIGGKSEADELVITDFSPEWSYVDGAVKVLITGNWYGFGDDMEFSCFFGDIKVPAELIQPGVIRCYAPGNSFIIFRK